ncbi:Trehalase [Gryllus bimaculatus]|nr:Trehalase [Gryllus bimaculatus]
MRPAERAAHPFSSRGHQLVSVANQIYCQGDLLRVIQNAHLYTDSKTFIDKKLLQSPADTLADFDAFMQTYKNAPTNAQIQSFVDAHFADGDELVAVDLEDWVEQPALLGRIADPQLRDWASQLNVIWKSLSRKVNDTIKDHSDRYSIIYVPNHFVVPGGRFRELYYWDTYWVVRGLILSDMTSTIKGILENFFYLLDNYGIIPNGARVYYLQRTQPPLLTPMVYEYYQATKDAAFVRDHIALLERELDFWLKNRTLQVNKDGKTYTLAHYYAPSKGPRPESYWYALIALDDDDACSMEGRLHQRRDLRRRGPEGRVLRRPQIGRRVRVGFLQPLVHH